MKLQKNIQKNIETIKNYNQNSSDFVDRILDWDGKKIGYIYLESVSSDDKISDFLVQNISLIIKNKKSIFDDVYATLKNTIYNSHLLTSDSIEDIFSKLASGFTCILVEGCKEAILIETKTKLDRGVSEATTETVIRGPKDSFTENNSINIGLIRKRIKDSNLIFKELIIGRRTQSKVNIIYIDDIVEQDKVNNIVQKLQKIDIDGIIDSGYLRSFLEPVQKSCFPKFQSTERPDLACTSLLDGKIIIMGENSPFVLITPSLFIDFIHNPDDYYQKAVNVNVTRVLRVIAFFMTLLTPGLYIALTTFNPEIIPNELLISIAIQQSGVPFPTAFEILIMIISFEVLRESDTRIPNAMGAAVSIVGALILGEAAVSAGVVSPIVIIIVAITSISGLLFTDIDFINALRTWRIIFIFFSAFAGLIGFVSCCIILTIKLCSMEENGLPYLTPFAPLYLKDQDDAIRRIPRNKMFFRPTYLTKKNIRRLGDSHEN